MRVTASEARRAIAAALATATALGLHAVDAMVLQESNAVTLRLMPCDTVARVTAPDREVTRVARELEIVRGLAELGCPVVRPDPRVAVSVHENDGVAITFWTHHASAGPRAVAPERYARALERLHDGMRRLGGSSAPRFTDRVSAAQRLIDNPDRTPDVGDAERDLLSRTLRHAIRAIEAVGPPEQLLHGEPHPGNLLGTAAGPLFIDWETCCVGPVEFDLAHAPPAVDAHYRVADPGLLLECRILVLAMITTWRWDREDRLPDGRRLGRQWLAELRSALERDGRDST